MRRMAIASVFMVIMLAGCSGARPVLYPNAHMQSVGKEVAEQDIEACKQLATSAGADERSGSSLLTGLFSAAVGPSQPNHAHTNFINRCLQEKGYEVTGWQ
ncbi:MAG: hypothetical protein HZB34_03545 [Nitrospirae bacterium]|nr:hypothetical protein [Nitrospirota bacterium]